MNVNCAYCGIEFFIKPSRAKKSRSGLFFCCREHKDLAQHIDSGIDVQPSHYGKINYNGRYCDNCGKALVGRQKKYCGYSCNHDATIENSVMQWLSGNIVGHSTSFHIRTWVRAYLLRINNYSCSGCGYSDVHPVTGNPILTIDHVDGDVTNSSFDNLRVLCYNCHAKTETFGSLNRNKGNGHRTEYVKNMYRQ